MCRFSSLAIFCSSWSQSLSPEYVPVLRCEMRVASSWKETYAIELSTLCELCEM